MKVVKRNEKIKRKKAKFATACLGLESIF